MTIFFSNFILSAWKSAHLSNGWCRFQMSLCEIFPFEIWIFYIHYNGPNYNGVMVTEIYPTLPSNCCYLDMFKMKNCLFSCLDNSRKSQAATYYVKVYKFQTSLACYGPSKVKNKCIFDLLKKIQLVEFDLPKISQ